MEAYANRIRIGILTVRGHTDSSILDSPKELDIAITKLASRVLTKNQLIVFFFAYSKIDSWENITDLILKRIDKKIKVATVKEHGKDAEEALIQAAKDSKEIKEWERINIE